MAGGGLRLSNFPAHEKAVRAALNNDAVLAYTVDVLEDGEGQAIWAVIERLKDRGVKIPGNAEVAKDVVWCIRAVVLGEYPTLVEAAEIRMRQRHESLVSRDDAKGKLVLHRKPRQLADYLVERDPTGVIFGADEGVRAVVLTTLQLNWYLDVTAPDQTDYPQIGLIHLWRGESDVGRIERGVRFTVALSNQGKLMRAERTDMDAVAEGAGPTLDLARVRSWLELSAGVPPIDARSVDRLRNSVLPVQWAQMPNHHPGLKYRPSTDIPDRAPKQVLSDD
jgi:hypothetical protein